MQDNEPKQDSIPKRKSRKKAIISVAGAGAIIIAGAAYLFSSPPEADSFKRDKYERDSRGIHIIKFIEEKDNAFHDYLIAARLHQKPEKESKIEEKLDNFISDSNEISSVSDDLRDYIKQNENAIKMIETGIAKDKYIGLEFNCLDDLLPHISEFKSMAKIMIARAKIMQIGKNHKEAFNEYFNVMEFANDISKDGLIISCLVSRGIDSLTLKTMRPSFRNLDTETLETIIPRLKEVEDNLAPNSELLKTENEIRLNTAEYMMKNRGNLKKVLKIFKDGGVCYKINRENWKDNLVINAKWLYVLFNKNKIRRSLENYAEKSVGFADAKLNKGDVEEFEKKYIGKDPISQVLSPPSPEIAIGQIKKSHECLKAEFIGTGLRAAVELYQNKYNQLPNNLQDLVNVKIIEQVPTDPFSNEPFKYLDNKIYSIGPDFKDDNAAIEYRKSKDNKELGDIVF